MKEQKTRCHNVNESRGLRETPIETERLPCGPYCGCAFPLDFFSLLLKTILKSWQYYNYEEPERGGCASGMGMSDFIII